MKKNVASQTIGAQMVSATDGSAFTGSVTVYVCGDAGTQAAGSVGSGACTHEGNGYHSYAPAQAETNYDLVAFTFVGTGAVPATVQVFTGYPQTGDNYARLGAPAGASVSADIAAVKSDTAAVLEDTGTTLPATLATIDGIVDDILVDTGTTLPASLSLIDSYLDTEVAAIKAKTDNLPASPAATGAAMTLTAAYDAAKTAATQASVDDLPTNAELATALAGADDAVLAAIADVPTVAEFEARTLAAASYATATALDAVDNYVDTEVAAIKAVTDKLDTALELDGAVYRYTANALELAPTGGSAPSAADIADAVWDEALSGHTTAGTTGKKLTDLANADLSGVATAAALATVAGYVDTEVASILAAVDTEVAAIKAKTDNLPASPAAVGSAMTLTAAYDAAKTAATQASVDDLPTNAELATALAGADDAVLAAVADVPTVAEFEARTLAAADYVVVSDLPAAAPSAADVADAVWDEAIAGHAAVGSTGAALASAGAAGDPWSVALPGSYAAGSAGKLLSDLPANTDTALSATHGAGSWEDGGAGAGVGSYTDTITDGASPLDGVRVQLSTDSAGSNVVYETYTDALGVFAMRPDPGTYYRWLDLAGYTFTQGIEVEVTA